MNISKPNGACLALVFFLIAPAAMVRAEPRPAFAQAEVRIPTEAEIGRMQRRSISRPPLDDSDEIVTGGQVDRQLDQRAHRIDEKLLHGGGICSDCD
jgi:hypothetical protein